MNLFRSEEHIARWLGGRAPGATISVVALSELAHAWWGDRLDPATAAIRMANPFSAVPTPYRVLTADRWWYANCAWDAFGICAALHVDGLIETSCPDCGDELRVRVANQLPDDESLLFHCLVPAANWWDDIVFT